MCRLAAYLGPSVPLSSLLYDAPYSLHEQAYAPRRQRHGHVNVDGTGIAWWQPGQPEPLRYVTDRPPWSDANLPQLAPRLHAGVQLAAVRSATPGLGYGAGCAAPFVFGRLAGAHNGWIKEFRPRMARTLRQCLPDHLEAVVDVASDSLLLFLFVVDALEQDTDGDLADAVRTGVATVAAVCGDEDVEATLTLVVADGEQVVGCNTAVGVEANGLVALAGSNRWPDAVLLASEPLDDDAWGPVGENELVAVTPDGLTRQRL